MQIQNRKSQHVGHLSAAHEQTLMWSPAAMSQGAQLSSQPDPNDP